MYGYTSALVHYASTVRKRVARPGRRLRRVCTGTLVHSEQTKQSGNECEAREEDEATMYAYTFTQ